MNLTAGNDRVLENFFTHLNTAGISSVSRKNYASDINHFVGWLIFKLKATWGTQIEALSEALPFLKPNLAKEYREYLKENNLSVSTVNRRLSTLRQLAKFLTLVQLLDFDFMQGIENISADKPGGEHPLLHQFEKYLGSENVSKNTAKNYLSDIRHFLNWIEAQERSTARG